MNNGISTQNYRIVKYSNFQKRSLKYVKHFVQNIPRRAKYTKIYNIPIF